MAEITDKFGKASADNTYAQATTVRVSRAAGESVLAAFDLSKFNDTRPVFFVTYKKTTDPEDPNKAIVTNQTGWKALVNADNNTLTNLTLAPGYTDVGNEVGDYIELMPTSFWVNELVDGLSQTINPDGTPKDTRTIQYTDELLADSIVTNTGLVTVVTGRTVAISNMTYYMNGIRLTKTGIPNRACAATKDTYGYINAAGTVTYVEVAVDATPTPPANSIPFVKVTTNASAVTARVHLSRGAVGADQLDFDKVGLQYFHANNTNAITFVAPFDGIAKVTHSRNGWGFAGGLFAFSMTTPTGLTKLFNQEGVTQGHDGQGVQMIASCTFSGLKKGVSYTFNFLATTGSAGGYVGSAPWLAEVSRLS